MFIKFIVQVSEMYGKEHCSYNVHLLTHLAESVRQRGMLWANSAFVYEDINGKLLKLFSGTQCVPFQIFKGFFAAQKLMRHDRHTFDSVPAEARDMFLKLTGSRPHILKSIHVSLDVVTLGKCEKRPLLIEERVALEKVGSQLNHLTLDQLNVSVYKRCVIVNKLYCTARYATGVVVKALDS